VKTVDVEFALLPETLETPVREALAAAGLGRCVRSEDVHADTVPKVLVLGVLGTPLKAESFLDSDPAAWWDRIETALVSVFERLERVSAMAAHGGGRLVLVVDDAGVCGTADRSTGSALGGAAIAMTKSLAREFSPLGVAVNAVAVQSHLLEHPDGSYPMEVAETITFLADAELDHLTGQIVACNAATLRTRI